MIRTISRWALCATIFAAAPWAVMSAESYKLTSPSGGLSIEVQCGDEIKWQVATSDETILTPSPLSMSFTDGTVWGAKPKVVRSSRQSIAETIPSPFYRKSQIDDAYNQLSLAFKGGFELQFRAYDDGAAYRFVSTDPKSRFVENEQVRFCFEGDYPAIVPYVLDRLGDKKTFAAQFANSFESTYTHALLSELDPARLAFLPLIVTTPSGRRVCITESDLEDYPGLYLNNGDGSHSLQGVFPPYPAATQIGGHNMLQHMVVQAEPYIARIEGKRTFPWRAVIVAERDADLLSNDMVYRLASPTRTGDTSWIRPGRVAWEWWNDWGVYGVDFKTGINTDTYKYYIDFAAEYGLEYIILDEGWSVKYEGDLYRVVPELDLQAIIDYGRSKDVGVILWAGYAAIDKDIEGICRHYSRMGVKGFKVDFMDRDDQQLVRFIYDLCEAAAKNRMILDLHGMYKPTGLNRTYPNVLNFEGVFGLERVKWTPLEEGDFVTYDVTAPFLRQVAGPMDYTQGAMLNATREVYRPNMSEPMSQGTRCRQLAEYVVFESPVNMLCDSPVKYRREEESARFIASIPTVWDTTMPLDGRIGEYITVARRKGDTWYVGGMTDWNPRTATVDLGALPAGNYHVELFRDGANADKYAQDYKRELFALPDDRKIEVEMQPGGGFAAIITPVR